MQTRAIYSAACCALLAALTACRGSSPMPPAQMAATGSEQRTSQAFSGIHPFGATPDTWTTLASMTYVRTDFPTVALGGKLYAIGGLGPVTQTARVTAYDPVGDAWADVASLPGPREGSAAAAVNGTIYVIGGEQSCGCIVRQVFAYDPVGNSWSPRTPIPFGRFGGSAAVVNNLIYVIGGFDDTWGATSTVQVYDPSTDRWSYRTSMRHPVVGSATAVVNDDIYVIGNSNPYSGPAATFRVYHTDTDTWQFLAPLPVPLQDVAAAAIGNIIYVAGGVKSVGSAFIPSDGLWAYDTTTKTWTPKAKMPGVNNFPSGTAMNGLFYVVGGARYSSGLRAAYSYTP